MVEEDTQYMRRALRLAARAAGRTSPNPMVGAVVVRGGKIVGEGYHHAAGEAHAEMNALTNAGDAARGATLYTALEPCTHQGRTPPCVDAIATAGVRRVVAAMRDPDPRTDGKGFRRLKAAGVEIEQGVLEAEALRLNEGFVSRMRRGRPFVLVKLATTIDGRVTAPGRPLRHFSLGCTARQPRALTRLLTGAVDVSQGDDHSLRESPTGLLDQASVWALLSV